MRFSVEIDVPEHLRLDMEALLTATRQCEQLAAQLAGATTRRDSLVVKLSEVGGLTRRQVAIAAGLTPGRVQQIITRRRQGP